MLATALIAAAFRRWRLDLERLLWPYSHREVYRNGDVTDSYPIADVFEWARLRGRRAFGCGHPVFNNPHPRGTHAYCGWETGWKESRASAVGG
jgi:hypothetical protein